MAVKTLIFGWLSSGLSGDTKPSLADGALYLETDTGKVHSRESGAWVEHTNAAYEPSGSVNAISAASILAKLVTVDGAGSGLDADLLDGLSSAAFAAASHSHPESDITSLVSDLALKQPFSIPYAPGASFTVPTGTARLFINRLTLTGSQRATVQGTGRLRVSN